MKIPLSLPNEHPHSIIQRVLDGTLVVDTVDEFKDILKIYPDDPMLRRKFADLLLAKNRIGEALKAFDIASRLFIDEGMNLQAIVAKILQWGIQKPTHDQGRRFQKLLSQKGAQHTPLQRFWANMRYAELVTVMLRLVRVRLSVGNQITCVDDPAAEIYFVVSGTLAETISPDCQMEAANAGVETEPMLLGANDIFGNVFPLDHPTHSHTDVMAVNDVELVKISKPVLNEIRGKFPNIINLLLGMYKADNENRCDRCWLTVRRYVRYGIPTKAALTPALSKGKASDRKYSAIAVDLSLGGVCVDLGYQEILPEDPFGRGQYLHLSLDMKNKIETMKLSGKIVWHRKQTMEKEASVLIGIRFDPLKTTDRKMIIDYCARHTADELNTPPD